MQQAKNKQRSVKNSFYRSKGLIISAVIGIVILVAGWLVYSAIRTYPLGDNKAIVYIDKHSGGNFPILSSSAPYTDYYYATDMRPEEVVRYLNLSIKKQVYATTEGGLYEASTAQNVDIQINISRKDDVNKSWVKHASQKYIVAIADHDYIAILQSMK
jgi:hypothetical protein